MSHFEYLVGWISARGTLSFETIKGPNKDVYCGITFRRFSKDKDVKPRYSSDTHRPMEVQLQELYDELRNAS